MVQKPNFRYRNPHFNNNCRRDIPGGKNGECLYGLERAGQRDRLLETPALLDLAVPVPLDDGSAVGELTGVFQFFAAPLIPDLECAV